MRRMFSEKQIKKMIEESSFEIVEALRGKDLSLANLGITEDLSVNGEAKVFEAIIDENNQKRFIEGTITPNVVEGITYSYAKWSLSGTHLMIVLAGSIDENTSIGFFAFATLQLPSWIKDKLYPTGQTEGIISAKSCEMWIDGISEVSSKLYVALQIVNNNVKISTWNSPAWENTDKCYFRIAFDLLIDNESEE